MLNSVWDFNWVGAIQGVQVQRRQALYREELVPDVEVGADVVRGKEGSPGGKAFLQPELVPPGKRHQIAKPLMGNLGQMVTKTIRAKKMKLPHG